MFNVPFGQVSGDSLSKISDESDAEKFLRGQGFQPATPEESRMIREATARTDAKIARQLAVS
jgi:hypothetical protein